MKLLAPPTWVPAQLLGLGLGDFLDVASAPGQALAVGGAVVGVGGTALTEVSGWLRFGRPAGGGGVGQRGAQEQGGE